MALQETWNIPHPDLIQIPDFNFIHTQRKNQKGGGVGFLIKEGINYKIIQEHSTFIPFLFECLTIETTFNNKKFLLAPSTYRSPNPPKNTSITNHNKSFINQLNNLLHSLPSQFNESYILLNSNINLLHPKLNNLLNHTLNQSKQTITNSFIQSIHKATRSQNSSHSLIDHIITNTRSSIINSGTIVIDISDHFMTFIQLPSKYPKSFQKEKVTHNLNSENISRLRDCLTNLTWQNVLNCHDVDSSFNLFWTQFLEFFNMCIPLKKKQI